MKRILIAVCIAFAVLTVRAAILSDNVYPVATAYTADYNTVNLAGLNTNVLGTNQVDQNLYHTVNFWESTNLNGCQFAVDNSLDSTNWNLGNTNTLPGTTQGGIFSTNFVFKTGYIRYRVFGTNINGESTT